VTPKIALQLYSVREALAQDYPAVLRQVAAMGYTAVETAGFPGTTPEAAAHLFKELGLTVCSAHVALPVGDQQQEVFDTLALLNCRRAVCAWLPEERFTTVDSIRRVCDELNAGSAACQAHGITLYYHNHWWELAPVDGRPALMHMLDYLEPHVLLEIDTYWALTAGVDPAALLRELGPRAPLLHIKDGPATTDAAMVAVGSGVMDLPAILAAAGAADWLIVELDRCDGDMMAALAQSYRHLAGMVGQG
jgi:sugar phosphate isomerase/epimerase